MAELLAVGKEFKSFEALQDAVYEYEQTCFTQLSRTDSRTIENEESRRSSKLFNPNIKYSFVTFTCAFGGKPYISRSTGIRNSKPRIKCNCPVILKCFASADGQKLVVRVSSLDCHNHDTSEESFKALPRGRLLDEETEQEIYLLIESHENKKLARKLVKEKLVEETGREITYRDIQNIEKRMGKRKGHGDRNGKTEDEDSDASMHSDPEGDEEMKGENADESVENDNADEGSSPDKKDKVQKAQNSPKKKGKTTATATPSTQARSTGRPRREIREPTRFRDPALRVSSSVLKRRASESDNSWEDSDSAPETLVKKEPQSGRRGRPKATAAKKVKVETPEKEDEGSSGEGSDKEQASQKEKESSSSSSKLQEAATKKSESKERSSSSSDSHSLASRQLDMEERRLQIQEEMLNLQRQSMLLLQNVVQKLDRVEANQKTTGEDPKNDPGSGGGGDAASSNAGVTTPQQTDSSNDGGGATVKDSVGVEGQNSTVASSTTATSTTTSTVTNEQQAEAAKPDAEPVSVSNE